MGDKESSVTRHLADVVTFSIRPELAGMTRLELANQLIEGQPAFHFAFVPMVHGARGEIRTLRKTDLKSAASSNWATRAGRNSDCGIRIADSFQDL